MLGVNLRGVVHGISVFIPIMLEQDTECHIVNTASMAGLITEPTLVIYAVTKAGVITMSEGLYLQLKHMRSRVGVSVLCPAFVESRLGEAARNRPEELLNPPDAPRRNELPPNELLKASRDFMSPAGCAEIVFSAMREDRFYILTDPLINKLTEQRVKNILKGLNPEIPRVN